jgi:hypothetical protein
VIRARHAHDREGLQLCVGAEQRENSAALTRKLIGKIVLTPKPNDSGLTIDLYGDLVGILPAKK